MKTTLIYLAGVATPFIVGIALSLVGEFSHWRAKRRYKRAWDKFEAEFNALPPQQLALHRAHWEEHSYQYQQFHNDLGRYFSMRWQYGNTKEV